ncbi:MAG TPA: hypothetical protein VJB08_05155 [Candidatus Nanoarchaeia archaeon]|nr:hypothetical protein [Candidatus Nanoarchaeia archaeon]
MALEKTANPQIREYNALFKDLVSKNGWKTDNIYHFDRGSWNVFMDATKKLAPQLKGTYLYLAFAANKLFRYAQAVHEFSERGLEAGPSFLEKLIGYPAEQLWRFNPEEAVLNAGIVQSPLTNVQKALDYIIPFLEDEVFDYEPPLFRDRRHEEKGNDFFSFNSKTGWIQYAVPPFTQSNSQQALISFGQQFVVSQDVKAKECPDVPQSLLPFASQQLGLFANPASDPDYFESEILIAGLEIGSPPMFNINVSPGDAFANLARNYQRILQSLDMQQLPSSKTVKEYVENSKGILEASKLKDAIRKRLTAKNN